MTATRTAALAATNSRAFTRYSDDDARYGRFPRTICKGMHHSDTLEHGTCDACKRGVTRTERGSILDATAGCYGGTPHECDPAVVALVTAERAAAIASGTLVKGATVTVVKGRKVAKGTRGIVRWLGESAYGERVGLAVEGTDGLVYTAASNVEVDSSEVPATPATALAEVSRYEQAVREGHERTVASYAFTTGMVTLAQDALATPGAKHDVAALRLRESLDTLVRDADAYVAAAAWLAAHPA